MRLTLPADRYRTSETITTFFEQLLDRVHAVPGVISAGMASQFPPLGPFSSQIEVEGAPAAGSTLPTANSTIVSRGYFRTLNVPVIAGRIFDERDRRGGPRVVVVNEAFAGRYLSGRPAIGARVRLASRDGSAPWSEIIGVVRSARNQGLAEPPQPEVFVSMERGRDAWNQLFLLVRSDRELAGLLPDLRQAVRSIDSDQPVYAIQTLQQAMAGSIFQQRLAARLLAVFAAAAVVLAAIGIYGVMSFAVTTRTQEMGVRLAVGAQRRDVMWLVLSQVLWLTAAGLAIGTGLLLAVGRLLEQLLYGVEPADPATIAAVCTILGAVALAAAWVPAFRASRVDVIEALRYE